MGLGALDDLVDSVGEQAVRLPMNSDCSVGLGASANQKTFASFSSTQ